MSKIIKTISTLVSLLFAIIFYVFFLHAEHISDMARLGKAAEDNGDCIDILDSWGTLALENENWEYETGRIENSDEWRHRTDASSYYTMFDADALFNPLQVTALCNDNQKVIDVILKKY